ncbi:hypothetical protein EIK77_010184 [Talaromyces pinophilus]|uniref:Asl1-like glycosyl hydrolase catalytic domain-containing protein n=1 Tax=Talaromyces pinophilus TaxID=128442 RepID=A0A0B8N1V5_TALPI|nr:hypothetical protein EIK77_010184 [Talaromyces pinophilus]PCG89005.1 Glycoside hydrolase, superfamily [Penicillium occitanis (nom. inval.)]PCG89251.1 hypothetical protein PENOC_107340 [Penicillium occitanis (nom. inval.)]GAM43126.1 hypothetical protein TCE0_047f17685 [Talaromyces pinophilus]
MSLNSPLMSIGMLTAILGVSSIQGAAAQCSDGLVNVVFNTGHGGFTEQRWEQIHSASNWITFDFGLADKQIPMLGNDDAAISHAIDVVNGPNPPDFMLTFNEPDNKYGVTPREVILQPAEAASLIKRLLDNRGNHTKFIAPVPAYDNLPWLDEFYGNCSCRDAFSAYNVHVYNETFEEARDRIVAFHETWNDKPLWITEIAPRQKGPCPNPIPWDNSIQFMQQIYTLGGLTEWIEKIFWNSANEIDCGDTNVAASFLLDYNNQSTPLLDAFNQLACS